MPTHAVTPHGRRLDELLADGDWHDLELVLAAVARTVTPGQAYRTAERQRKRKGNPGPRAEGDEATAIAAGAREVARAATWNRTTERREHEGRTQIRRRPS